MKADRIFLGIALVGLIGGIVCVAAGAVPIAGIIWAGSAIVSGAGIRAARKKH